MVGQAGYGVDKVRYTHEAMIDLIIDQPSISQNEIAKYFGYSVGWISQIITSDAFQAKLAERRGELIDPMLVRSLEERFKGLATQSLEVVQKRLEATSDADLALKALEITTKALGYGARAQNVAIQQNFVVQAPTKAATIEDWSSEYAQAGVEAVVEERPAVPPPVLEKIPNAPKMVPAVGTGEMLEVPKPRAVVGTRHIPGGDGHLQQDLFE